MNNIEFTLDNGQQITALVQDFYESAFKHNFKALLNGKEVTVEYNYSDEDQFQIRVVKGAFSDMYLKSYYYKDILISKGYNIRTSLSILDNDASAVVYYSDVSSELMCLNDIITTKNVWGTISDYVLSKTHAVYRLHEDGTIVEYTENELINLTASIIMNPEVMKHIFLRKANLPDLKIVTVPINVTLIVPIVDVMNDHKNHFINSFEELDYKLTHYIDYENITYNDDDISIN